MDSDHTTRAIALAALVMLSGIAGSIVFAGNARAETNNIRIISDQPIAGTGNLTVQVNSQRNASFQIEDAAGTVSATAFVKDDGPEDRNPKDGVIRTDLDLGELFNGTVASGTATLYAGHEFSIANQTYGTKRQFAIDADAPEATLLNGATGKQGTQVRIDYTVTDVPQKVRSATMRVVGPDGNVAMTVDGLQAGKSRTAQVNLPSNIPAGEYNITLTAVDEVGHRTTDTLEDGLTVTTAAGRVGNLLIISQQPVAGSGNLTVKVAADGKVSFKVQDANGTISATKTVIDGKSGDLAQSDGTVRTTLDLSELYNDTPVSGTAIVYAGGGDGFSVPDQTFDTKRQVALDSDSPSATVVSGGSAKQGGKAKVVYTVSDVPQKIRSLEIRIIGPDGLIYTVVDNLQAGKTVSAEFGVPAYAPPGEYDVKLVTVDEVGHRATDRLNDSVTVKQGNTTDTGEQSNGVTASDIRIVSSEPVRGSGDLVVRTAVSDVGVNASFRMTDSTGAVSELKTVTDGGSGDRADRMAAVIETTLNMTRLFDGTPASGTAVAYAAGGDTLNVSAQTFQTKRQVALDSEAPTATVHADPATAEPGQQVKITYTATDDPQKVGSVTMTVVGSNGTVYMTVTGLQAGTGRTAQFVVPSDTPPGEYDVKLAVVDEVGHRTTDTLENGLTVE